MDQGEFVKTRFKRNDDGSTNNITETSDGVTTRTFTYPDGSFYVNTTLRDGSVGVLTTNSTGQQNYSVSYIDGRKKYQYLYPNGTQAFYNEKYGGYQMKVLVQPSGVNETYVKHLNESIQNLVTHPNGSSQSYFEDMTGQKFEQMIFVNKSRFNVSTSSNGRYIKKLYPDGMIVETFLNDKKKNNFTKQTKDGIVLETLVPWEPPVEEQKKGEIRVVTVKEEDEELMNQI